MKLATAFFTGYLVNLLEICKKLYSVGVVSNYYIVECNNLWDGLRELWRDYDNVEIWTDAHNLHIDLYHHDGTHRLILREYKNITDTQKENFECADKTSRVLTRYTTSLLDKVA